MRMNQRLNGKFCIIYFSVAHVNTRTNAAARNRLTQLPKLFAGLGHMARVNVVGVVMCIDRSDNPSFSICDDCSLKPTQIEGCSEKLSIGDCILLLDHTILWSYENLAFLKASEPDNFSILELRKENVGICVEGIFVAGRTLDDLAQVKNEVLQGATVV